MNILIHQRCLTDSDPLETYKERIPAITEDDHFEKRFPSRSCHRNLVCFDVRDFKETDCCYHRIWWHTSFPQIGSPQQPRSRLKSPNKLCVGQKRNLKLEITSPAIYLSNCEKFHFMCPIYAIRAVYFIFLWLIYILDTN
jgi:hypothetical protein